MAMSTTRDRGVSLVVSALPRTVAKLAGSLDKHTAALVVKYKNRLPAEIKKLSIDSATKDAEVDGGADDTGMKKMDEVDLFLDSISVIIQRMKDRIIANPAKVYKVYAKTDLHRHLVKAVERLVPSGDLWITHEVRYCSPFCG